MRWTSCARSTQSLSPDRQRVGAKLAWPRVAWVVLAVLAVALVLSGASPEKHLAVYSVAANYSLPLVQRDGRDYVGLLELLEPLGKVSAKADGGRWRLRYNNVEADFQAGKSRAQVQGRDADLG